MSKSEHTKEAEHLLAEWTDSIVYLDQLLSENTRRYDELKLHMMLQSNILKAAQVHATLAESMRP
jgi:hypothetical protein